MAKPNAQRPPGRLSAACRARQERGSHPIKQSSPRNAGTTASAERGTAHRPRPEPAFREDRTDALAGRPTRRKRRFLRSWDFRWQTSPRERNRPVGAMPKQQRRSTRRGGPTASAGSVRSAECVGQVPARGVRDRRIQARSVGSPPSEAAADPTESAPVITADPSPKVDVAHACAIAERSGSRRSGRRSDRRSGADAVTTSASPASRGPDAQ